MILSDWQIRQRCQENQMIWPFRDDLLNPASLDLVVGTQIMVEVRDTLELQRIDICNRTADEPWLLMPGEFILAETQEIFNIPEDVAALFFLKSSRAREGFEHSHAGFIDPGFNGSRLTLELSNVRKHHPLAIYPNLKIGQCVFMQLSSVPQHNYSQTGRYNKKAHVEPSADGVSTTRNSETF